MELLQPLTYSCPYCGETGDTLVIRYDSMEQHFQLLQKGAKYKIKVIE